MVARAGGVSAVIESFVSSWSLFRDAYLSGCLIAALLGVIGVLIVARDHIFLGAAVSQASMLGLTVGLELGWSSAGWYEFDAFTSLLGSAFAIVGALITGSLRGLGGESREAVTGWVFCVGLSLSVLLVAHSPHGLEEVHRLVSSTIVGATLVDVELLTALTLVTASILVVGWRTLVLVTMDPEAASAAGVRVVWWDRALYVWLGLAIALAMRVSGLVFTFGFLVLPALVAKGTVREMRSMLWLAPVVAVVVAMMSFFIAHGYDLPPAHVAVAGLCGAVAVAWSLRSLRR